MAAFGRPAALAQGAAAKLRERTDDTVSRGRTLPIQATIEHATAGTTIMAVSIEGAVVLAEITHPRWVGVMGVELMHVAGRSAP